MQSCHLPGLLQSFPLPSKQNTNYSFVSKISMILSYYFPVGLYYTFTSGNSEGLYPLDTTVVQSVEDKLFLLVISSALYTVL